MTPSFQFFILFAAFSAAFLGHRLASTGVRPVTVVLPDLPVFPPDDGDRLAGGIVEKIGEGDLVGPESLVVASSAKRGGSAAEVMFAALGDGRIVRLTEDAEDGTVAWETVLRTGKEAPGPGPGGADRCGTGGPADGTDTEAVCGRPLGLLLVKRRTVDGTFSGPRDEDALIVADAYKGLLLVTGIYGDAEAAASAEMRVLATRAAGDDKDYAFRLLNGVAQAPDGSLYVTETSRKFQRRRIFHAVFDGRPTGRLLRYAKGGGLPEVIADGLYMPNGVALAHDGKSLLIVSGVQILRYSLERGEMEPEPFVGVMPGTGDNLRAVSRLPTGEKRLCYWAGLGSKYAEPFALLKALSERPWMKAVLVALAPYEKIVEAIPKLSAFVVYDSDGELIETYRDSEARAPWLSEAEGMGDHLYLGSWYNPFLARVRKRDLVASAKK